MPTSTMKGPAGPSLRPANTKVRLSYITDTKKMGPKNVHQSQKLGHELRTSNTDLHILERHKRRIFDLIQTHVETYIGLSIYTKNDHSTGYPGTVLRMQYHSTLAVPDFFFCAK